MKFIDGSSASTAEDNAEVFARHFDGLYGCRAVYDDSVLFSLPERSHAEGLEDVPTDSEISLAISKLHDSAPGASGLRASAWKALADDRTTFDLIRNFVIEFWESEVLPCSWEVGLLSILPKKGDLSLPGNYRGIMMLEVGYKIIGHILLARLKVIKENAKHLDHEAQCGFRNGRGCRDGTFTVKSLVTKRREQHQETWILFLDLVKAFDKVPRELLWRVLTKLGVPDKLVSILKAMHIRMWRFSLKLMALEETQFDHRSKAGRSSRTRIVHLLYECSSRNLEIAALLLFVYHEIQRGLHPHRTESQDGWQKSQRQTVYRICGIGQ